MARKVSPAMEPYIRLQRSLPKDTPFAERGRLARELKARLAAGEGPRRRNPAPVPRRRNPGGSSLLMWGGIAAGAYWLWKHHGSTATSTATAPGPMATPSATNTGL